MEALRSARWEEILVVNPESLPDEVGRVTAFGLKIRTNKWIDISARALDLAPMVEWFVLDAGVVETERPLRHPAPEISLADVAPSLMGFERGSISLQVGTREYEAPEPFKETHSGVVAEDLLVISSSNKHKLFVYPDRKIPLSIILDWRPEGPDLGSVRSFRPL